MLFEWIKVSEKHHAYGVRYLGFIKRFKSKDEYVRAEAFKKEVGFIVPQNEPYDVKKLIKVSKSCNHTETDIIEFPYRFENKTEMKYCKKCSKVLNKQQIKTENTQILINIAFAEGRLEEYEENIAEKLEQIEHLKQEIEEEKLSKEKEYEYIEEQKKLLT